MTRRTWDSKTKAQIVMEGLKGRAVASICAEYGINQALYYKWRDTFLQNADKAFEANAATKREQALELQNKKLKQAIGELTLELKKSDW